MTRAEQRRVSGIWRESEREGHTMRAAWSYRELRSERWMRAWKRCRLPAIIEWGARGRVPVFLGVCGRGIVRVSGCVGRAEEGSDFKVVCFLKKYEGWVLRCTGGAAITCVGLHESNAIQYFCSYCLARVNSWKFIHCFGLVSQYEKYYCLVLKFLIIVSVAPFFARRFYWILRIM